MKKLRDRLTIRQEDIYPEIPQCSRLVDFHPHDKNARARADLIFVPGLGGDFIGTWEAADETVWPRDLLPHRVKGIRIRSFSYNTTLFGTTGELGLRNHANELVWRILEDREDDEAAMLRPLVFVGHSLGGLLIKRAIKEAYDKPRLRPIWEASRGIMFFASPQYDMDSLAWPIFSNRVLRGVAPRRREGQVPTRGMLKSLERNRPCMMNIGTDFKPLQPQLAFATLLEEDTMEGYDTVLVSKAHGLIHDAYKERYSMLSGDHLALCKFAKEEGDEAPFATVSEYIEWLIGQTPKEIDTLTHQERRALFSLCAEEFHLYFLDREPTPETCAWIVDTVEFKNWLHDKASKEHKLWIKGPPGCGKSYLARHIIVNTVIDRESHEVIHCFLSSSVPGHGTLEALLRSTLHQALRAAPRLVGKFLLPTFEEGQKRHASNQSPWSEESVVGLWADTMAEVTARRSLAFVIDGFDEMDEQCRAGFLVCLGDLETKSGSAGPKFKLLLLSREDPKLEAELSSFGFVSRMATSKDTKEDVNRTVVAGLATVWGTLWGAAGKNPDDARRKEIYDTVTRRSEGVYLWATLVVQYLCRIRVNNGADLLGKIKGLPYDIEELYGKMLEQVFSRERFVLFAKQVLMWAMSQRWRLKAAEFNFAQALGLAIGKQKGPTVPTHEDLQEFLEDNIEIKVDHCCGHLVKFQGRRLEWAHGSLLLYLLDRGDEGYILAGLGFEKRASQAAVAQACIAYLNMEYFADAGAPREPGRMDLWESKVRRRVREHPFVRYAALNWRGHLEDAGAAAWRAHSGTPESHARSMRWREQLLSAESEHAKSWSEVWWFFTRGPSEDYPDGCLAALAASHREAAPDLDKLSTAPPEEAGAKTQEEALDSGDATSSPQAVPPSPEAALVIPKVTPSSSRTTALGSEDASTLFKATLSDPEAMLPSSECASLFSETAAVIPKVTPSSSGTTALGSEDASTLFKATLSDPEAMSPSSESASLFSESASLLTKVTSWSSVITTPGSEAASTFPKIASSNPKVVSPSSESASPPSIFASSNPEAVSPSSKAMTPFSEPTPPFPKATFPSSGITTPGSEIASPSPKPTSVLKAMPPPSTRPAFRRSRLEIPILEDEPPRSLEKTLCPHTAVVEPVPPQEDASPPPPVRGTPLYFHGPSTATVMAPQVAVVGQGQDTKTTHSDRTQINTIRSETTVTHTMEEVNNTKKRGWRQRMKGAAKGLAKAGKVLVHEAFDIGDKDRVVSREFVQETKVTRS
ncbi:hypothetical protein RB595_010224 [Gaeumannomyces hyphopodioides]